VFDSRGRLGAKFGVKLTPFVVVLDTSGIVRAKAIVNDYQAIKHLVSTVDEERRDRLVVKAGSRG